MKLNKTEQTLLNDLQKYFYLQLNCKQNGSRQVRAAYSLMEKGLVKVQHLPELELILVDPVKA